MPRRIGDERKTPRESYLAAGDAVQAERSRLDRAGAQRQRVLKPYAPRLPINAGDPASSAGTKVDLSELADDVTAAIAAGGSGSGDATIRTEEAPFTRLSGNPFDFGALVAGEAIIEVAVLIEVAFDDPTTVITFGKASATGGILPSNTIDPTTPGTYNSEEVVPVTAADACRLQVVPGASTQGAGRVVVTIQTPASP